MGAATYNDRQRRDLRAVESTKAEAQDIRMREKARRSALRLERFTDLEYRHLERACRIIHIQESHMRDQVVIARAKQLTAAETDAARHAWDLIQHRFEENYLSASSWFDQLNPSERVEPDNEHVLVLSGPSSVVGYCERRHTNVLTEIATQVSGFIAVEFHNEEGPE